ncbi:hypothetical protein HGRIS_001914 [Hohenbuehelia grisea]|uniref:Serine hydrolase domain-containing protein n=1 Tax=Hohenbuehelia grisea TaxID=104357 RepID=A0ABR3JKL9_9AGAR
MASAAVAALKATRVLVLHGFTQNGTIFRKRLGALRKQCGKDVDFYFFDAPIVLHPVDLSTFAANPQASLEALKSVDDPSATPRAWWRANDERTRAFGLEITLERLRDLLKREKFDGVLGFSQGAACAALLSALLEKPHVYPPFLVEGKSPHPPFEFCVAISGFRLHDPLADQIFGDSYSTPTVHIIGRTDVIVSEERSQQLVAVSANQRVEMHPGGHFFPSKRNWLQFLADYLRDSKAEVPPPSAFNQDTDTPVTSAPGSGASTPYTTEAGGGVARTSPPKL